MEYLRDYSDERLFDGCLYCGEDVESKEHAPSRMFLDKPYPENLPTVGTCKDCNVGFSLDESYVACLIEASLAGTADPAAMRRPKVAAHLQYSRQLQARLQDIIDRAMPGQAVYLGECERIERVLTKLAMCHALFELSQVRRNAPSSIWYCNIDDMSPEARDEFDSLPILGALGEIGSRGSLRTIVIQFTTVGPDGARTELGFAANDWLDVQEGRYRYLAADDEHGISVRMVIGDYLACEVNWNNDPS